MSCFLFHNWGKWELYNIEAKEVNKITGKYTGCKLYENRQKRACLDCGYTEDKHVSGDLLL